MHLLPTRLPADPLRNPQLQHSVIEVAQVDRLQAKRLAGPQGQHILGEVLIGTGRIDAQTSRRGIQVFPEQSLDHIGAERCLMGESGGLAHDLPHLREAFVSAQQVHNGSSLRLIPEPTTQLLRPFLDAVQGMGARGRTLRKDLWDIRKE